MDTNTNRPTNRLWTGGEWVSAHGGGTFEVLNPEDDSVYASVARAKANDTEYGLSAAIFTQNISHALDFAQETTAGMCHVNASPRHDEPHVPFGGSGESGVRREGFEADIDAMTEWEWVTVQL